MKTIKISPPVKIFNISTRSFMKDNNDEFEYLDFKTFMRSIVYLDARWDLSLKHLELFLSVYNKVEKLNDNDLFIEFTNDEFSIIYEIILKPTTKYNHVFASALLSHINSIINII